GGHSFEPSTAHERASRVSARADTGGALFPAYSAVAVHVTATPRDSSPSASSRSRSDNMRIPHAMKVFAAIHNQRRRRSRDGEGIGPHATRLAHARVGNSRAVVLVEGISDQIALETLAARRGRNLVEERVCIVPIGGAQAVGRFLAQFGPAGSDLRLAGLCDAGEEAVFGRGLGRAGFGSHLTRHEVARLGFYVCDDDLEDELIRAVGPASVEAVLASQGNLGSFRTFQKQPAWREQ